MSKKNKFKILVISPLFYPQVGGAQQHMEDLHVFLMKNHPEIAVDVLCYQTKKSLKTERYRGMNIYRLKCWNILPGQFALPKIFSLVNFLWIKRNNYDLIHCNTRFFDSSWWAPIYAKLIGRKIILTDHCASNPVHPNKIINFIANLLDLTIVRLALKSFNQVFSISIATQKFLKKVYGIDSYLVLGGVNLAVFKSKKRVNKKPLIIFIGRIIDTKGVKMLFQAAIKFPQNNFVFVGEGPLLHDLRKEAKQKKLKNIEFTGPVMQKGVAKMMLKADIFVLPSYHHEGVPLVLKEAGAAGLAVITTDAGGIREILSHRKTGLFIKQKDQRSLEKALELLINDSKLRKELSTNFNKSVRQKFNWRKISEDFYQQIKV